jgi:hypothetical protein
VEPINSSSDSVIHTIFVYIERAARGSVNGLGTVLSFHVWMVVAVVMVRSNDKKTKKTRAAKMMVYLLG